MVEVMNEVGFTHICLGNHEFDLPLKTLKKRLFEIQGAEILATNINFPPDVKGSPKAKYSQFDWNTKDMTISTLPNGIKIGWVGLCTEETIELLKSGGLYEKYDGLTFSKYVETALDTIHRLQYQNVDYIVMLTHLNIVEDRILAKEVKKYGIPVILGGHDHDEFDENINGVKIIKAGVDANKCCITRITFENDSQKPPVVETELVDVEGYEIKYPNKYKHIQDKCHKGEEQLKSFGDALLIPPANKDQPILSSKDPRNWQCSVGRYFCDKIKAFFKTEACLINSGKIRNNSEYLNGLTLVDVQSELPFKDNFAYTCTLTGFELEKTLKYSWTQKKGTGGFIQYDNAISFDTKSMTLGKVNNLPLDHKKQYAVALPISLLNGMDNIEPLAEVGRRINSKSVRLDYLLLLQDIVVKSCVLDHWKGLALQIKDFHLADINSDGMVSAEELKTFLKKNCPQITDGMIRLFFDALDADHNEKMSLEEWIAPSIH